MHNFVRKVQRPDRVVAVGQVKWFDPVKGYGFIIPGDGSSDLFVHQVHFFLQASTHYKCLKWTVILLEIQFIVFLGGFLVPVLHDFKYATKSNWILLHSGAMCQRLG